MLKIAVTGNIASGKSQAEKIILKEGYPVYDTDKMAHEILDTLTDFYGYDVFTDGKIDRKKLGELVFNNADIKQKLENLIHPKIKSEILQIFEHHKNDKFVFISVPLLYETGFETLFDKVILITAEYNIRKQRLIKRNNFSEEEAVKRIQSQIPQEQKLNKADYIINNNDSLESLETQIINMIKTLN